MFDSVPGLADEVREIATHALEWVIPGKARWKQTSARITDSVLTAPSAVPNGAVPLDAVLEERPRSWVDRRSPGWSAVMRTVEPLLTAEPAAPDNLADSLRTLRDFVVIGARCRGRCLGNGGSRSR